MPNDFKLGFEIKKMMKVKTFSFGNPDVFSLEFLMIPVKKKCNQLFDPSSNKKFIFLLANFEKVDDKNIFVEKSKNVAKIWIF